MKNPTDVISGIALLGVCGISAWSASSLPDPTHLEFFGPASLPKLLTVLLGICSLILIFNGIRTAPIKAYWSEKKVLKKIGVFILLFYAYLVTLTYLGDFFLQMAEPIVEYGGAFTISTAGFLLIALPLLGRRNIIEVLLVTVITTAVLLGVFGGFFQVLLP